MDPNEIAEAAGDAYDSVQGILHIVEEPVVRAVFGLVWAQRGAVDAEVAGDADAVKRIQALDKLAWA